MSEYIVKIIPRNPFFKASTPALSSAKAFLEGQIHCDSIAVTSSETPLFIDCGTNLEKIFCPSCGAALDFGWWGDAMDKAAEKAFLCLETEMPCCKKTISLNDLTYEFPCSFACHTICLYNPKPFRKDTILEAVQAILGTDVRLIEAHL